MNPEPPPFQESNRCDVCYCSFTTFRRRHHCRSCGRTLCHDHSSNQMPLPQFGIHTNVRVCSDCFNSFFKSTGHSSVGSGDRVDVAESVSRLNINGDSEHECEPSPPQPPVPTNLVCKCGMPLCICQASTPPTEAAPPMQAVSNSTSVASNARPSKKDTISRQRRSTQGSSVSVGPSASGSDKPKADYAVSGEGLREAIKNSDISGVKDLLNKGVDSNYRDKQGLSLLHLAAVFNQTEIVFALMDHGATLDSKNLQGETPLDCAPVTLQCKMKKKIEEGLN